MAPALSATQDSTPQDSTNQFLTFACAGRMMAVDIVTVREIRGWAPPTPLPASAPGAMGVLNIRGRVVPIFELAALIGQPEAAPEAGVILILSRDDADLGLRVDSVSDIVFAKPEAIRPIPHAAMGTGTHLVRGMLEKDDALIALLDIAAVRSPEDVERVYLD